MKTLLITLTILLAAINVSCQPQDTTIVINIVTDDTLNICIDDTAYIHYIINYIPGDTICEPVIVEDTLAATYWYGYEIDSTWLGVNMPNGDLPRRENGTYKVWKTDLAGNLIPKKTIRYYYPDGEYLVWSVEYMNMDYWQTDFWKQ